MHSGVHTPPPLLDDKHLVGHAAASSSARDPPARSAKAPPWLCAALRCAVTLCPGCTMSEASTSAAAPPRAAEFPVAFVCPPATRLTRL